MNIKEISTHLERSETTIVKYMQQAGIPKKDFYSEDDLRLLTEIKKQKQGNSTTFKPIDNAGEILDTTTNKNIKIFYTHGWTNTNQLGKYYNDFMKMLPDGDNVYGCIVDGDTQYTTDYWGKQLTDIVSKYPEYDMLTCVTNRVKCKEQVLSNAPQSDDAIEHRQFGVKQASQHYYEVDDITNIQGLMSGVLMLIKKSSWQKVGGFKEDGILKVDNSLHKKFKEQGYKVGLMRGFYIYHYYRGGDVKQKNHINEMGSELNTFDVLEKYKHNSHISNIFDIENKIDNDIGKKYNQLNKLCLTAITGGYDDVHDPNVKNNSWKFICMTDTQGIKSDIWNVKRTGDKGLDTIRLARYFKIMSPVIFSDYDIIVWTDARITINCNLDKIVDKYLTEYDIAVRKHPSRQCIYEEAEACINMNRESKEVVQSQLSKIINNNYPEKNGLAETNVLIFRNSTNVQEFAKKWWDFVYKLSARDQLSFNYLLWKFEKKIKCNMFEMNISPNNENEKYMFDFYGNKHKNGFYRV